MLLHVNEMFTMKKTQYLKLTKMSNTDTTKTKGESGTRPVFALLFFHLLVRKPNLENLSIYSNKFVHNLHLSESSFTCPGLLVSGLAWRLLGKDRQFLFLLTHRCVIHIAM